MLSLCENILEIDTKSNLIKGKVNELKSILKEQKEDAVSDVQLKEKRIRKDEYIQKLNLIEEEVNNISYDGSTIEMKEAVFVKRVVV